MTDLIFRTNTTTGGNSTPSGISLAGFGNLTYSTQSNHIAIGLNTALGENDTLYGAGFTYASGQLTGGTITEIDNTRSDNSGFILRGISVPVATFNAWVQSNQSSTFLSATLGGGANVFGTPNNDTLQGYGGSNIFYPATGSDSIIGGSGIDTVVLPDAFHQDTISGSPPNHATITGPDLNDTLSSVERVQFIDGTEYYDAGSPAAEVVRMYQAALGRAADPLGLAYWVSALSNGASLNQLASSFIGSAEFQARFPGAAQNPASFVTQLYSNVLGRAPDAGGLSYWTGLLQNGTQKQADVLQSFSESAENQARTAPLTANGVWAANEQASQVARLFYTTLGRAPDAGGLIYWTGQLTGGYATLEQEAAGFMATPEFQTQYSALGNQAFVDLLYRNVLGRPGDAGGEAYWTGQINNGSATRAGVVTSFSESAEHQSALAPRIDASGVLFS